MEGKDLYNPVGRNKNGGVAYVAANSNGTFHIRVGRGLHTSGYGEDLTKSEVLDLVIGLLRLINTPDVF